MSQLKVKAVIFRKDHTNAVVILNRKNRYGSTFRHNGQFYMLDEKSFQLTEDRSIFGTKRHYITYYYAENHGARPIPLQEIQDAPIDGGESLAPLDVDVQEEKKGPKVAYAIHPLPVPDFSKMPSTGIPPEELEQIFNPFFYRTLAALTKDLFAQIQFWLTVANVLVGVYLIYTFHTQGEILDAIAQKLEVVVD